MGSGISSRPRPVSVSNMTDVSVVSSKSSEILKDDIKQDVEGHAKIVIRDEHDGENEKHERDGNDIEEDEDERLAFMDGGEMNFDSEAGEFFANTALSLGMDNNDLLFNLLYFDDGHASTFGSVMNSVQQETLALHSSNNTPYKLKPASESAIAGLAVELFIPAECSERECSVCKDEMEKGCQIVRIPACSHYFHEECLIRWIKLQGWCPVCRAEICLPSPASAKESKSGKAKSPVSAVSRTLFVDSEGKEMI